MKISSLIALLVLFALSSSTFADTPKPKLGPLATRLVDSHEYFQTHPAPDFWAMMPNYVSQVWEGSCSVASVAMVVNAARAHMKLTADDKLATQQDLVAKVKGPVGNHSWADAVGANGKIEGMLHGGVNLDELAVVLRESLEQYGVKPVKIEVVHVDEINAASKKKLHDALVENEKSARDFIILNFNQKIYTGDAEAGHISPIAAYDARKKSVLVMDVDREWYDPYWVSEETLIQGLATRDTSNSRNRGYIWVQVAQ